MAVKNRLISTHDLQVGMYVSQLDRPWIETPFPLQGFHIRSEDDIQKLRVWCKQIYIDCQLGKAPMEVAPLSGQGRKAAVGGASHKVIGALGKFTPVRYPVSEGLRKEVVTAGVYHREITRAMIHLLKGLREGKSLNLRVARKAAAVMVHSVLRNPDAMVWLARLKDVDSYSYAHSIRASILATVFGRHIGLPKEILENLATGVLLMDVGKTRLSRALLSGTGKLSDDQWKEMRRHVEYGVDLLQHTGSVNDQMLAVVQYHHERFDGTGYPYGLSGSQIPLLARIAGIVDTYDAITSPRPWAEARTSSEAVSLLYEQRDKGFQGTLVEQFIQSIGVYPTGTMVELSNRQVGVVIAQNPARRLRPKVMVVLDESHQKLNQPRVIDLLKVQEDDAGSTLSISGCLRSGMYDVDLASLQINSA